MIITNERHFTSAVDTGSRYCMRKLSGAPDEPDRLNLKIESKRTICKATFVKKGDALFSGRLSHKELNHLIEKSFAFIIDLKP